ncbi:MAG: rhodanese-like domain-containing protein [Bacteroidetes bacterium]|nr:rhodanese-like domain-containing protein [Bacteroidota bacterium]
MKYNIIGILFLIIFSSNVSAQKTENQCYSEINCNDLRLITETKDVLLIDVRLNREYRKERIENAFLASDSRALKDLLHQVDKEQIIVIYCEEGTRSKVAAQIVCNDLKFTNVFNLQGGLISWKKRGYYVETRRLKESKD